MIQDLPEPQFQGRTNADLLNWALKLREALRLANSDKAALRAWVDGRADFLQPDSRHFFAEQP